MCTPARWHKGDLLPNTLPVAFSGWLLIPLLPAVLFRLVTASVFVQDLHPSKTWTGCTSENGVLCLLVSRALHVNSEWSESSSLCAILLCRFGPSQSSWIVC